MFIPITDSSFSMPPLYRAALHRVPPKNIRRAPYEPTATPFFGTPYPHFISVRTPSLTIEALLPHRLRGPKAPTVVIYLSPAPPNTIQVTFCTALSVRYMHIPRPTLTHPYIPYEKKPSKENAENESCQAFTTTATHRQGTASGSSSKPSALSCKNPKRAHRIK